MELRYLSSLFYQKYKDCPEIMSKGETRPYIILIIEVENNTFAIPIRTNLHKKIHEIDDFEFCPGDVELLKIGFKSIK